MSNSSAPVDRSGPQDGDLVVTTESPDAVHVHYAVRHLPGPVQFTASTREEAVRLARGFAERQRIDVWYSENGTDYLLEAFRPGTSPRRARKADIA